MKDVWSERKTMIRGTLFALHSIFYQFQNMKQKRIDELCKRYKGRRSFHFLKTIRLEWWQFCHPSGWEGGRGDSGKCFGRLKLNQESSGPVRLFAHRIDRARSHIPVICRSFNYRPYAAPYGAERDNCELSDRDSRDMEMGSQVYYDTSSDYDFYERNNGRQGADGECLDGKRPVFVRAAPIRELGSSPGNLFERIKVVEKDCKHTHETQIKFPNF